MDSHHHQQKTSSTSGTKLPKGYNRFAQVLANIVNKIENQKIPIEDIKYVDLNKNLPETLSEKYPTFGKRGWYFVTRRNRKYRNGSHVDRNVDGYGYWKANGKRKDISAADGERIGWKNSLVFHQRKQGKDTKTSWSMHEYGAYISESGREANVMELDYVVCRIYKTRIYQKASKLKGQQKDHQVDEVTPNSQVEQVTNTEIQLTDNNEEDPSAVPVNKDNVNQ